MHPQSATRVASADQPVGIGAESGSAFAVADVNVATFSAWFARAAGGECWMWTGPRFTNGYGRIYVPGLGRKVSAHRVAWVVAHGSIPAAAVVLHECDTPLCVNPAHLRLGTHLDNVRDMVEKGRHASTQRTHCRKGHPYDEANTRVVRSARGAVRHCRTCDRATNNGPRRRRAAAAAA